MSNRLLILISSSLSFALIAPLTAQDFGRFTTSIGGGLSTPLNPTAQYAGLSGNFAFTGGYKIDRKNAIVGEFLWSGLPANAFVLHPVSVPQGHISLYSLTVNYRHQMDIHDSPFGFYVVGGGGWFYRYASLDKNYVVPPSTVCQPVYTWWGYGCDTGGYVYSQTVAYKGTSAGGLNVGAGFTIRLSDSNWRFFMESKYIYAWSPNVPTTLLPVTFGLRLN